MPARVLARLFADDEGAEHGRPAGRGPPGRARRPSSGAVRYLSQVRLVVRHRGPGRRHDTWALQRRLVRSRLQPRGSRSTAGRPWPARASKRSARTRLPAAGWPTPLRSSSSSRGRWRGCSSAGGPAARAECHLTSAGPGPPGSAPRPHRGRPRSGRCRPASGPAPHGGADLVEEVLQLAGLAGLVVVHVHDAGDLVEGEAETPAAEDQLEPDPVALVEDPGACRGARGEQAERLVVPDGAQRDVVLRARARVMVQRLLCPSAAPGLALTLRKRRTVLTLTSASNWRK